MPKVNLHFTIDEKLHMRLAKFASHHGDMAYMGRQAIEFYVSLREKEARELELEKIRRENTNGG